MLAAMDALPFIWEDDDRLGPSLSDAIIETVTVYTHIRMYILQTQLGGGATGTAGLRPDGNLGYSVGYNISGGMINLTAEMPCPVDLLIYWNAKIRLTMSIGRANSPFVNMSDMMQVC